MSKRNVTVKITSQKELIKFESDARTFGELQKENKNIKWNGMRVVERATKNTLQDSEAILPAGDFILFLVPEKVKAGAKVRKLKNIATAKYNELRSHGSHLNKAKKAQLDLSGSTDALRAVIQGYYDRLNPAKGEAKAEATTEIPADVDQALAKIEAARLNINEAIDVIKASVAEPVEVEVAVEDTTEYLIKTSLDDLEDELKGIKSRLKL